MFHCFFVNNKRLMIRFRSAVYEMQKKVVVNNTYFGKNTKNVLLNMQNMDILIIERGDKYGTVSERTISFKD